MTMTKSSRTSKNASPTPPSEQPAESEVTGKKPRQKASIGRIAAWVLLWVLLLITLFPFYWMLRTSLSNNLSLAGNPGNPFPVDFTLGAYKRVLGLATTEESMAEGGSGASIDFWLYLRNSVIVATLITVGQVVFCSMAAYAFARLKWTGRDLVFGILLCALMVPVIFTTIPNFITIRDLGLLNTHLGIALPTMLMTPFAIFFLRQFFLGINREVEEAAILDGAGHIRRFTSIALPLTGSPIATLAILTYINSWNEYFWPLVVGRAEDVRVLTVALGVFRSQTPQGGPDWAGLMAATLIAALPVIILFLLLGKRIINSIGYSGTK